ncbi:MAG: ATP-dependent DNA helicase [Kiritimatiellae bacterium]|nr:ATP-dependent DNA helicase [Kiritimatiellia bacterium]
MISVRDDSLDPPSPPDPLPPLELKGEVDDFFGPGGALQQRAESLGFDYEHRPQQHEMALLVADAIERGVHLAVEAGTGVGKSFAYLVPSILAALQTRTQVIVSTYSISLQEQLIHKDLPMLAEMLARPIRSVLVKGKGNYLCLRRLDRARSHGRELFSSETGVHLDSLLAWSRTTPEGTLQVLNPQPPSEVWNAVNVEHGNCMWQKCPEYEACFFMKARRRIHTADVLIVNHHLFFSDIGLRAQGVQLLPETSVAILDEAHQVEGVAADHLGVRLSLFTWEYWARRLYQPDAQRGLLSMLREGKAAHAVQNALTSVLFLYEKLSDLADLSERKPHCVLAEPPAVDASVTLELLRTALHEVRKVHDALEDLNLRAELNAARRRGEELVFTLESYLKQSFEDHVYWMELAGRRRRQPVLHSAPVEVAPILRQHLFEAWNTVILTSATLSVNDKLDYITGRLGVGEADTARVGSPFDFERQMTICLPTDMPDPTDAGAYRAACVKRIPAALAKTQGRAFVLFTNARWMKEVVSDLREKLIDQGYGLYVQNEDLSRQHMLDRFRADPAGVLFGLDSFWMGIDIRGDALRHVIITRLPFSVPDDPVVQARMARIKEQGGDPFRDYSLPEAILKFRQGAGRLIRSTTDTGLLTILDPRLQTKWYGKYFLHEFRDCRIEVESSAGEP